MHPLLWLFISVVACVFHGVVLPKVENVGNVRSLLEEGTVNNKTQYEGSGNPFKFSNKSSVKNGVNFEEKTGASNDSSNDEQNYSTKPSENMAFTSNKSISNVTYNARNFAKKGSVSNGYRFLRKHRKSSGRKHASHTHVRKDRKARTRKTYSYSKPSVQPRPVHVHVEHLHSGYTAHPAPASHEHTPSSRENVPAPQQSSEEEYNAPPCGARVLRPKISPEKGHDECSWESPKDYIGAFKKGNTRVLFNNSLPHWNIPRGKVIKNSDANLDASKSNGKEDTPENDKYNMQEGIMQEKEILTDLNKLQAMEGPIKPKLKSANPKRA